MEVYSLLLRQLKFVGYSALASCEWWGHGDAIVANHGAKEKRRRGIEGGRRKRKRATSYLFGESSRPFLPSFAVLRTFDHC